MPLQPVKPPTRAEELDRLRQELLRRIVLNEARRQTARRSEAK